MDERIARAKTAEVIPPQVAASSPVAAALPPPRPVEADEAVPTRPSTARFVAIPGWLVSAALHAIVLLALGWFYLPQLIKPTLTIYEGAIGEFQEELLPTQEINLQLETTSETTLAGVGEAQLTPGAVEIGFALDGASNAEDVSTAISFHGNLAALDGLGSAKGGSTLGDGAEFFGVKAAGNRFVFIVDSSNSMRGDKFQDACEELTYALRRLSSKQFFYVIFFDQNAERMIFAPNKEAEESFARATPANLKKVEDWIKTVGNELKTNPYEAVVFGSGLAPDAIYLLSDGKFTDKGATERYLRSHNLFNDPGVGVVAKAVVHTLAFYDADGEETLQRIAKEHHGTYRFVPRPKKK